MGKWVGTYTNSTIDQTKNNFEIELSDRRVLKVKTLGKNTNLNINGRWQVDNAGKFTASYDNGGAKITLYTTTTAATPTSIIGFYNNASGNLTGYIYLTN